MGNIPLTPPNNQSTPPSSATYRTVRKSAVDAYMAQLEEYNRPFKSIARVSASGTVELTRPVNQINYNPPQPVWVNGNDPAFLEDIETYNFQIQKIAANRGDLRMVDVLNNPPMPAPPPVANVVADPVPQPIGNPANYLPTPLTPAQNNIPGYANYVLMYSMGQQYLQPGQAYDTFVQFNPPTLRDNTYKLLMDKFVRLYDQIRRLHASNTGSDVFSMPFIAPNYSTSGSIESFVDAAAAPDTTTQVDQCMNVNTTQEAWYVSQILDLQGRFDAQKGICQTKGLKYDAAKCGVTNCVMPYNSRHTTAPPEPETSQQYNFNKLSFSASGFPARLDQTDYTARLASMETFKAADIEKYYNFLEDYNLYWVNQDGWRQISNPKQPYNPPLPPWIDMKAPALKEKQFLDAVRAFNEKAIAKLRTFNNYERINLPDDFGPLPAAPAYPNALYELLMKPRLFLTPVAASAFKDRGTGPDMKYEVPITELPILYEAAKKKAAATAAEPPAPKKPQCAGPSGSGVCITYDDELSDAAKLLLQNMEQRRKLQSRALEQTQPANVENVEGKLNTYYDSIRGDISNLVKSLLG